MKKQEEMFLTGAVKNGLTKEKAAEIFELIAPFAGYGFNKAHAACYAMIAYRTAYLKAHFPVEFMTALLTAESRGTTGPAKNEKISGAIAECKRLGVLILPPDINKSLADFSIENNIGVRFGLSAIKNVGEAAIEVILEARKSKPFASFQDFCSRINMSTVNKKTMESLIKAGAMDIFGNRAALLIELPEIVNKAAKLRKQESEGQSSLFGDEEPDDEQKMIATSGIVDFSPEEKLVFEKEFLGFYLTSHPHVETFTFLKTIVTHELELLDGEREGAMVRVGGVVENIRKIFTKKSNSEMAFLTVSNERGIGIDCVIFPKTYEKYKDMLISDTVIVLEGKLDSKNDRPTILAEKVFRAKNFVV